MNERAKKRICVIGSGISGLATAWALHHHPDLFDFVLYEKNDYIGGNAVTVDIPQDDGTSIPVDISVTAYIPTVYNHYAQLMARYQIESIPTRFSYSVTYGNGIYAHDFDSALKAELQPEIEKFQRLLLRVKWVNTLNWMKSSLTAALNPFNYLRMGQLLDLYGFSSAFRFKILKPLFVNFLLAGNVFDMPAAMFCMYLDFFNIEKSTPMATWDQGTRNIYRHMTAGFADRIHLQRGVERVIRTPDAVFVVDEHHVQERFDEVVLACNANQALMVLAEPNALERWILSSVRYESELHNHAIVHTDASVLPQNETRPLDTRSNYVLQYGSRPDNYELTYIMHNQQPWAKRSDKPCLVTYNPVQPIDPQKIVKKMWFQHVVHDVFHSTVLLGMFRYIQGQNRTYYCGAHTLVNSQEHCFISGLTVARQLGARYPFAEAAGREWFNFYGRMMMGSAFAAA